MSGRIRVGLSGVRGGLEARGPTPILELARLAESLGFDCLWFNEEHFTRQSSDRRHHTLSPVVLATAVAASTTRLRVGFSVLLVPLHHPLRLAEELATLDVLSRGRLNVGVSRANSQRYSAAFGYDRAHGQTLEECLDKIIAYWHGGAVNEDGTEVFEPRPVQTPHPPIYVGAYSEDSIRWAAKCEFRLIQHGIQSPGSLDRCLRLFGDQGGDMEHVPIGRFCYVGESDAAARREVWDTVVAQTETLRRVGLRSHIITEDDLDPERFYHETAIVGGPETVTERINELLSTYGSRYVNLLSSFFGHLPEELLRSSLHAFSTNVMPRLD